MVDVSAKNSTKRTATAQGRIYIPEIAYHIIRGSPPSNPDVSEGQRLNAPASQKARSKGDVLTVAQLAAIMGAKKTADIIPLCHPLFLSNVSVHLELEQRSDPGEDAATPSLFQYSVLCCATTTCTGQTGVEMEALTAVSVGLLTVWDMLKAVAGKEMVIGDIFVEEKTGGKSGDFVRTLREGID